jgi:hypothetical protein
MMTDRQASQIFSHRPRPRSSIISNSCKTSVAGFVKADGGSSLFSMLMAVLVKCMNFFSRFALDGLSKVSVQNRAMPSS